MPMLKTLRRGWVVYYPQGLQYGSWVRDHDGEGFYLNKPAPKKIGFTGQRSRATAYATRAIADLEGRHMGMGDMELIYVDLDS